MSLQSNKWYRKVLPAWLGWLFSIILLAWCGTLGYSVSDNPTKVFASMSGAMAYLGIIASVSLAVLAMIGQFFDRKVKSSPTAHLTLVRSVRSHIKTESIRVVILVFPIIFYTITSMADFDRNKWAAGILSACTVFALCISIMLPIKYASLMRDYIHSVFVDAEREREKERGVALRTLENWKSENSHD